MRANQMVRLDVKEIELGTCSYVATKLRKL